MFDVPSKLPKILAEVSAKTALFRFLICPFSSFNLAGSAIAVRVPVVSKKSTKNITNTTDKKAVVVSAEKSREKAALAIGGAEIRPLKLASPVNQPSADSPKIVMRMLPLTPNLSKAAIKMRPVKASIVSGLFRLPNPTSVSGLSTIRPAPCRPIMARNKPIPAVMAICISAGIERISQLRMRVIEKMKKAIEEIKTAVSACCQLSPYPSTTTKAK